MSRTVPFQIIQFSTQKVPFQTIKFSIRDMTISGASTPGPSGPGSDGNEGVHHIPQSSSITGTWPSDCLVSYIQDTHWGVFQRCSRCFLQLQAMKIMITKSEIKAKITRLSDNKKKGIWREVGFAVPTDHRSEIKESEKRDKYLDLAKKLRKPWNITVTVHLELSPKPWKGDWKSWKSQKELRALLRSARLLRRDMETWWDLLVTQTHLPSRLEL